MNLRPRVTPVDHSLHVFQEVGKEGAFLFPMEKGVVVIEMFSVNGCVFIRVACPWAYRRAH